MGATRTINNFTNTQNAIHDCISSLSDNPFVDRLRLYRFLFLGELRGRRAMHATRQLWEECEQFCENGACATNTFERTKDIREAYGSIINRLKQSGILSDFWVQMLADSMSEWDELVEDCYIAGDQKIREDIKNIADLL